MVNGGKVVPISSQKKQVDLILTGSPRPPSLPTPSNTNLQPAFNLFYSHFFTQTLMTPRPLKVALPLCVSISYKQRCFALSI